MGLYRHVIRPLLFRADPEWVHNRAIAASEIAGWHGPLCSAISSMQTVRDPRVARADSDGADL